MSKCACEHTDISGYPILKHMQSRSGNFCKEVAVLAHMMSSALKSKRRFMFSAITISERHFDSAF